MTDSAAVQTHLIQELASIDSSSVEPLLENISPGGEVVRLNLRPFKARQGGHDVLFRAMVQTARTFQKSPELLATHWHALEQLAQPGAVAFDAAAMHAFFQKMREKDFPAVHHSKIYEEKYQPAYRVILRRYAPRL